MGTKQDKSLPEQLYREALAIEKLILQNPSFVPYDSFAKIFEELKGNNLLQQWLLFDL